MSTLQSVNFELISDAIPVVRRDFPLADTTLIDPLNASCLYDGEWMIVNDANKMVRATAIATDGAKALNGAHLVRSFPLWAERGRTDIQALKKTTLLYGGWFEANTRVFKATAKADGDATTNYPAITYVGQPLQVATITIGTRAVSGLVGADITDFTANSPFIVGWVTRLPSTNGGQLRFRVEPCR